MMMTMMIIIHIYMYKNREFMTHLWRLYTSKDDAVARAHTARARMSIFYVALHFLSFYSSRGWVYIYKVSWHIHINIYIHKYTYIYIDKYINTCVAMRMESREKDERTKYNTHILKSYVKRRFSRLSGWCM